MRHFLLPAVALATALFFSSCQSENLCELMDDAVFKKYCLQNFDTNGDGELHQEEADAVKYINIEGLDIVSLKGIEHFTKLEYLYAANCEKLREVIIPNTVISIEDNAFYGCNSLKSITIPNSVTEIGEDAFNGCTGKLIVNCDILEARETGWRKYASIFENSNFTSIVIGDDVKSIGYFAFRDCASLETVTIGKKVTEIGDCAFYGCSSLESITIPNGVTSIGNNAFEGCSSLESITIPDSVIEIGENAFQECEGLTSVHISDLSAWCKINFATSQTTPLSYAKNLYLNGKLVTELTIPSNITEIKDYTFYNCESLTSVTIPDSVTEIGYGSFTGCINLQEFTGKFASQDGRCLIVDGELKRVAGSGLTEYTIPDSVTKIGNQALSGCDSSTSITIPESVTEFEWGALSSFPGELIVNCNIPKVSGNYDSPFCRNDFRSVIIGDSVTSIGNNAFIECGNLRSVTISDSVTEIGSLAFYDCDYLESVTIGNGITMVGGAAFYDCGNLKHIYCKATTPPAYYFWRVGRIYHQNYYNIVKNDDTIIYVPRNSVEAYKESDWGRHIIEPYDF